MTGVEVEWVSTEGVVCYVCDGHGPVHESHTTAMVHKEGCDLYSASYWASEPPNLFDHSVPSCVSIG